MIKVMGNMDKKLAQNMLKEWFGPNGLSAKKHMDLMVTISEKLDQD